MRLDIIEQALTEGACRALTRRAATLRTQAHQQTTMITDQWGGAVAIVSPEASVMIGTAALLEECAVDLMQGDRP